ncbi:MAG: phytanoyl-CoA dioxygenase family protein [Caulobacteraceae bacterium]
MSLERQAVLATRDLGKARDDLARAGFAIIEEALRPAELDALRARLSEQAAGEDAAGLGFHDGGANQRVWMLVNKGRLFRDLVLHPLALEMMSRLLGGDFLLSSLTANIARPGGKAMYLHTDQIYLGFWTAQPMVANIAWMLDDFTEQNGATRVIPASHLEPHAVGPEAGETIPIEGPEGSALVFDGRLVHGTGANLAASGERRALLAYYCRPFIRQQENFSLGLDPALRREAEPELLKRLGFAIWRGLGRIESPREGALADEARRPGPLSAGGAPIKAEARLSRT